LSLVDIPTLMALIIVCLFVSFLILVSKSKPSKSQVLEMEKSGVEIVNMIKDQVSCLQKEKVELEERFKEIKHYLNVQKNEQGFKEKEEQVAKIEESILKEDNEGTKIVELYKEGYSIAEIAKILDIQKAVVEVSLSFENIDMRA
jgi:uncharacterized membrane protein YhiD involved in acid resistance